MNKSIDDDFNNGFCNAGIGFIKCALKRNLGCNLILLLVGKYDTN